MAVTEDYLHRLIRTQALKPKDAQALAVAFGHDPSHVPVRCEADGCDVERPLAEMFSFLAVLATTGPEVAPGLRLAAIQCGDEQHYGCSLSHAALSHAQCIERHIAPAHAALAASALTASQTQGGERGDAGNG